MTRIAMVSMHGCPLAKLGEKDAGGMNVYVRQLGIALGGLGHQVDIFTRCQDYSSTQIVDLGPGTRVVHIEAGAVQYIDKRDLFPILPEFTQRVEGFRQEAHLSYDVVHSHYWLSGWSGMVLQRDWGVPLVHMFHTLGAVKNAVARSESEREPARRIAVERQVVASADRVVVANRAEKKDLMRFYDAPEGKLAIVPCGVDLQLFRPLPQDQARALLNLPAQGRVILFVGRLEPIKGVDVLLDALAHLRCEDCDGQLLVVGGNLDGEEAARLRGLIQELNLSDRVRLLGAQDQSTLPYIYAAADLCVIPSFYESFGMVAIEAMACGRPVIASRAGGLQFTVRHERTGLLVPPGDSLALADALERLVKDAGLRQRMGAAGLRAAHRYSWTRVAQEIHAVYESVLAQPRGGDKG
jgi:D-inositol-3-phosphate glycosyltransferase